MKKTLSVLVGMALLLSCAKKESKNEDPEPKPTYTSVEITSNELGYSLNQDFNNMVLPDFWYTLQTTYNEQAAHEHTLSSITSFPLLPQKLDLSEAKFNNADMTEFSKGVYILPFFTKLSDNTCNYKLKDKADAYKYNVNIAMSLPDSFSVKNISTAIDKDEDMELELSKTITHADYTEVQLHQHDNNGNEVKIATVPVDPASRKVLIPQEYFNKLSTDRDASIKIVSNRFGSKLVDAKKHVFTHSITVDLGTFAVHE